MPSFLSLDDLVEQRAQLDRRYLEFLRVPAISAGLYVLPVGSVDTQQPHNEDELYFVVRGKARMRIGSQTENVHAGSIIFAEAKVNHRFFEITEELRLLVFFAPAESQ
jgi:mannose-6-phosphate isomerase-like protein (cupin superfamily)